MKKIPRFNQLKTWFIQKKNAKKTILLQQEALIQQHDAFKQMLDYYYYEISDLRSKVRYLVANASCSIPTIEQTYESFNYQWENLNAGQHLLSDDTFKSQVKQLIVDYTRLPEDWFKGKKILDAGCGQGRFTYGFSLLGADITAIDQSEHAVINTRHVIKDNAPNALVKQHDLLTPLQLPNDFDLVWSYGVLHHTGDTYKAFKHISNLVKPQGYLFLMLYGEPQLGNIQSFHEQYEYARLRHMTRNMNYQEKIDLLLKEKQHDQLHGWFDAISPTVNDTYSLEEIKSWLHSAGFGHIQVTSTSTNHHVIAQKMV